MTKELNNFTHCSKLDLIKMYKKSRRDVRRLSRQKVELKQQIEKMKADVKQGQSYWNSGEMQYHLYQRLLDKWGIKEK